MRKTMNPTKTRPKTDARKGGEGNVVYIILSVSFLLPTYHIYQRIINYKHGEQKAVIGLG